MAQRANLDVEIAVDMMALVGSYDTAVLVSGDGDRLCGECGWLSRRSRRGGES